MSSPTGVVSTERDEFISVVRALALPAENDVIAEASVAALRGVLEDSVHAIDNPPSTFDAEHKESYVAQAREMARDYALQVAAIEFFIRCRKFPQFRRALCEAVAQEPGMNPHDVLALAPPKE